MPLNDALPHEPYNRTDRDFAVTPTASMGEFPAYCSSGCNYWGGESETKSMLAMDSYFAFKVISFPSLRPSLSLRGNCVNPTASPVALALTHKH